MCGIVGYVGDRIATPMLLEGLKRLEYRGYDSAGVAIMNGEGVETRRAAGKIARLDAAIAKDPPQGTMGIAHTRWIHMQFVVELQIGAFNHIRRLRLGKAHTHGRCFRFVGVQQ